VKPRVAVSGLVLLLGATASAHRLDEYLQATTISLERDRVRLTMRMTPGEAVSRRIIQGIDTDGDGVVSKPEERAYCNRVLRDITLTVDGKRVTPRLVAFTFPRAAELKKGLAGIRLEFVSAFSRGSRKLDFENRHQRRIAAYLVNCLVPTDPALRVKSQRRNRNQSKYELEYVLVARR
jgi:hypothetical protein